MIRTENWCGYDIRFIEIDGEWWGHLEGHLRCAETKN